MKITATLLRLNFDRLTIFSFLWGVATLYHIASFPENSLRNPFAWLTAVTALILLFKPSSLGLFVTMLLFSIAKTINWMPYPPNHILFELILNMGILTALSYEFFRRFRINIGNNKIHYHRDALFESFAPFTRISLLLLYFFAVLHKLNADYLNPTISCGSVFLTEIKSNGFTFIPDGDWIKVMAVYGTILLETAIPLLLLFKRTRTPGIIVGLALHFFFTFHPHSGLVSFSALLFSLFFLFAGADFPARLRSTFTRLVQGNSRTVKTIGILSMIAFAALILILSTVNHPGSTTDLFIFVSWCLWSLFLIVTFLSVTLTENVSNKTYSYFKINHALLWLFPAVIFFNGISPYLGFKTETSFAMFSNLRTEGNKTNHLFIPASLHLTNWQEDLIEISNTDLKALNAYVVKEQLITSFEFTRIVLRNLENDFYVSYRRGGVPLNLQVSKGKIRSVDTLLEIPYLIDKVMYFRPIDKGPCLCKH